ncbi:U-box domain-containing protein 21-like [Arachis stenosperma]|uniref:U-box domain-containing protein 21-like n=1 Tax=Arachis stenosperma TaxID=217475 RepID=UPI0025AB6F37|nr:U-box domain-containing protein 21-like [Arachis stenosperma]
MVLGWSRRRKNNNHKANGKPSMELVIPNHFRCPISLDLMKDPVTLSTGITYDRESVERWFDDGNFKCPVTSQIVKNFDMIPNHSLRMMIQDWCVENRQHGVERIPTPRIPISPTDVSDLLLQLKESSLRLEQFTCLELIQKMERWGAESERNKRIIVDNGAPAALASSFDSFAGDSVERNVGVLDEILSALKWMFPLQLEAQKSLGSIASLSCMVWFLKHQDLPGKEKSIVALKELLSFGDSNNVEALSKIEGVNELLVELVNKRISPTVTKNSLRVIWYMVSSSKSECGEKMKISFVELGFVNTLLGVLIDSEKSICEKALAIYDCLCSSEKGRESALGNDLTIPVLVKKVLRISSLSTDYSVSAIWKMCKFGERGDEEGKVLVEALQVGAFQKLLLVLQVGCGDSTKEKATELLKLMNPYRAELECIDSDFKNLKRSF